MGGLRVLLLLLSTRCMSRLDLLLLLSTHCMSLLGLLLVSGLCVLLLLWPLLRLLSTRCMSLLSLLLVSGLCVRLLLRPLLRLLSTHRMSLLGLPLLLSGLCVLLLLGPLLRLLRAILSLLRLRLRMLLLRGWPRGLLLRLRLMLLRPACFSLCCSCCARAGTIVPKSTNAAAVPKARTNCISNHLHQCHWRVGMRTASPLFAVFQSFGCLGVGFSPVYRPIGVIGR